MKVIFLDFDGVIVTRRTRYVEGDPVAVELLNQLIKESGANLVISSSWRIGRQLIHLKDILNEWGVKGTVVGRTPHLVEPTDGALVLSDTRGKEIDLWLKNSRHEVSTFVILDDDKDMEPHMERLVQTSTSEGLTSAHVARAIELLRTP